MNEHIPVLLESTEGGAASPAGVLSFLKPKSGDYILDATLGLGGHSLAFAKAIGPAGRLFALDADGENLALAKRRLSSVGDRCTFVHANFRDVRSLGFPPVDIVFADLGLSSPHIDDPSRGFTFRQDAPLDLRFDRSSGIPASVLLERASEVELKKIMQEYGELPSPGRLSSLLYRAVRHGGVASTARLGEVVTSAYGYRAQMLLPQIFQALRIAVNDEIGALDAFLGDAPTMLKPGGRLGIISYHSLEDRRIKQAFRLLAHTPVDAVTGAPVSKAPFRILTHKPVIPSEEEQARNPRSRSAKFRVLLREPQGD